MNSTNTSVIESAKVITSDKSAGAIKTASAREVKVTKSRKAKKTVTLPSVALTNDGIRNAIKMGLSIESNHPQEVARFVNGTLESAASGMSLASLTLFAASRVGETYGNAVFTEVEKAFPKSAKDIRSLCKNILPCVPAETLATCTNVYGLRELSLPIRDKSHAQHGAILEAIKAGKSLNACKALLPAKAPATRATGGETKQETPKAPVITQADGAKAIKDAFAAYAREKGESLALALIRDIAKSYADKITIQNVKR